MYYMHYMPDYIPSYYIIHYIYCIPGYVPAYYIYIYTYSDIVIQYKYNKKHRCNVDIILETRRKRKKIKTICVYDYML